LGTGTGTRLEKTKDLPLSDRFTIFELNFVWYIIYIVQDTTLSLSLLIYPEVDWRHFSHAFFPPITSIPPINVLSTSGITTTPLSSSPSILQNCRNHTWYRHSGPVDRVRESRLLSCPSTSSSSESSTLIVRAD
jgi:hypothetical protein